MCDECIWTYVFVISTPDSESLSMHIYWVHPNNLCDLKDFLLGFEDLHFGSMLNKLNHVNITVQSRVRLWHIHSPYIQSLNAGSDTLSVFLSLYPFFLQ